MTYNQIIQKAGKIIKKHVYYIVGGTTTNVIDDNVENIKFNMQTPLIGTSMNSCEIILKEEILGDIYVQIEAKYENNTATETFGPFVLGEKPIYDANKKTFLHKVYDNFVKSMVNYEPLTGLTYPCTIYQYFTALTTQLGYTNNILSLPNGTLQMPNDVFEDIGYTYRDVLDDIAYANGVLFYMDQNEIKIATLGGNSITINDDILKNKNIDFSEHYGPINTIVLNRSSETDTIYTEDAQSVTQNGRCEFKITDNQLMNGNDRADYLPALLTQLDGIEYDIYDTELTGWGKLMPLQSVVFNTNGATYNSYIFNNETTLTTGYKQAIYNDRPQQSETDYKYTDTDDRQQNQAYILINKKIGDVDIRGKTINMTADNIAINSTNFSVDKDGNMTCNNATINGTLEKNITGLGTVKIGKSAGNLIEFEYISGANTSYGRFYPDGFAYLYNNHNQIQLYRNNLYVADSNGATTIRLDGSLGEMTCKKITAGNIDSGACTLNSSSVVSVSFNKTFASIPKVVVTPNTTSSGVIAPKIREVSKTGFKAIIGGSGFSNIDCDWIAIDS